MNSDSNNLDRDQRLVHSAWPEWQLMEWIGGGQYGNVYKARKRGFAGDSFAAIKIVTIENTDRESGLDIEQTDSYLASIAHNYAREIKMMESVKGYSNIVNIEDYHVVKNSGGNPWHVLIRMELLIPLHEYLETREITDDTIIRIGTDLCRALEVCGTKQIVHRDIKPANVFVNNDGVIKLGDFGVARQILDYTSQTRTGSPGFMAPEVYHGSLRATDFERAQRADIYSLGMLLYWCANKRRMPFEKLTGLMTADDIRDAFERKMSGEQVPDPVNASDGLKKVILKACSYNASERYLSAAQFREALEGVSAGNARHKKSHRSLLKMVLAVCALLVGAFVLLKALGYEFYFWKWPEETVFMTLKPSTPPPIPTPTPPSTPPETPTPAATPTPESIEITPEEKLVTLVAPTATPTIEPTDSDDSGTCGENLQWQLLGNELHISGTGGMYDYSTSTKPPWDQYRTIIEKIVVDEGTTKIGKYAFFQFEELTEVELPHSLRRINDMAFGYCYKLPSLLIPEGVEHIEESIIYRCRKLERIDLPGSVRLIEGSFAGECENLTTITLGDNCADYAVRDGVLFDASMEELICHPAGLDDLTYTIPDKVRAVGVYAFAENKNLLEVIIPEGLTTIDSCAFTSCRNLKSITIPDSVGTLERYAFYGCEKLKSVRLSENIGWIDQQAFYDCYSLEEIVIPSKVTRIGTAVFGNCINLKKIVIPPSVNSISASAFEGSPNVVIFCERGSVAEQFAAEQEMQVCFTDTEAEERTEPSETGNTDEGAEHISAAVLTAAPVPSLSSKYSGVKVKLREYSAGHSAEKITLYAGPGKKYGKNVGIRPSSQKSLTAYFTENDWVFTYMELKSNSGKMYIYVPKDYFDKNSQKSIEKLPEVNTPDCLDGIVLKETVPAWGPNNKFATEKECAASEGTVVKVFFKEGNYLYCEYDCRSGTVRMWLSKSAVRIQN